MLSTALDSSIINAAITQYWRVSVVELTTSTQSDVVELARAGSIQAGHVLAAEYQSAGRGRLARNFEAPKSTALLFSHLRALFSQFLKETEFRFNHRRDNLYLELL